MSWNLLGISMACIYSTAHFHKGLLVNSNTKEQPRGFSTFFFLSLIWDLFFFNHNIATTNPDKRFISSCALLSLTLPFLAPSDTARTPILLSLTHSLCIITSKKFLCYHSLPFHSLVLVFFSSHSLPFYSLALVFLFQDSGISQTVPFGGQHLLDWSKILPANTPAEPLPSIVHLLVCLCVPVLRFTYPGA